MIDVWDQFIHSPQSFYLMYCCTYICYLWFCNMSCLGWLAVGFTSILILLIMSQRMVVHLIIQSAIVKKIYCKKICPKT